MIVADGTTQADLADYALALVTAVVVPYLAWIGYRVIALGLEQTKLAARLDRKNEEQDGRLNFIERNCLAHHEWMGTMDQKVDAANGKLDRVLGALEAKGIVKG
jgi:hypothetical protein